MFEGLLGRYVVTGRGCRVLLTVTPLHVQPKIRDETVTDRYTGSRLLTYRDSEVKEPRFHVVISIGKFTLYFDGVGCVPGKVLTVRRNVGQGGIVELSVGS